MPEFSYTDLLPLGADETEYRLITSEGVRVVEAAGRRFLEVEPEALRLLTETAIHDISHYLRASHLAQLRKIVDDPESSGNDRFVALDLLKNAVDLGRRRAADVPGHRHRDRDGQARPPRPHRRADDAAHIVAGRLRRVHETEPPLLPDGPASPCGRRRTPAPTCPPRSSSTPSGDDAYKLLFMAKGGGSANKSLPLPGDQGGPQREAHAGLPGGEDPLPRHGRLPAVPPRRRRRAARPPSSR